MIPFHFTNIGFLWVCSHASPHILYLSGETTGDAARKKFPIMILDVFDAYCSATAASLLINFAVSLQYVICINAIIAGSLKHLKQWQTL